MTNPYSFAHGVANTRVTVAPEDATLADLRSAFGKPLELDVPAVTYHNGTKKQKSDWKKPLPYFVGGTLEPAKRDDKNVQTRTLLTLDIEQGDPTGAQPPDPREVVDTLKDLGGEGWVYTSLGHTPDRPRYRVVLPLGRPLAADQDALRASTQAAAGKLGLTDWCTPESWVLSQAMYLPAKLKGGTFYEAYTRGRAWAGVRGVKEEKQVADIPDGPLDPVLSALRHAGLYLREDAKHPGKHYIRCPFADQHEAENETQTVYYAAHYDGNPRAAVKCFDTAPDEDGVSHLTYATLVRWLKKGGHLSDMEQADAGVLDEAEDFFAAASVGPMLDQEPVTREWAIERFAPVGKVTVFAGPGGQGKSYLMLHLLTHAAMGLSWGGFEVKEPVRSLYVSYEDDQQELHGRVHGLAGALKQADDGTLDMLNDVDGSIRRNLFVYAAEDTAASWLLLTKPDRFAPAERTARVEWLVEALKARGVRMLVLDPAVYIHQLEENNIADMAALMQTLSHIAKHAGCAVVVLHHMSKAASWVSLDEVNQGSLRGASSLADNARSVAVGMSLSSKDAPTYGIAEEDAGQYFVFKHVKHNYSGSMGTRFFHRQGPLLVPVNSVGRLTPAEQAQARENIKHEQEDARLGALAGKVLTVLLGCSEPVSQTTVAVAAGLKSNRTKQVLEWCEARDLVEIERGGGWGKTSLHLITQAGKSYVRGLKTPPKK